jgi:Tfp pilus assembly protein PilO
MSRISILVYVSLTLLVGYIFIYPSVGNLTALLEEKQKYESSLETVNNIETKKEELLTKFNQISADDKKEIETVLPSSLNLLRLVSDIDAVAAGRGISIKSITSKETASPAAASAEEAKPQKPYNSSIIGFSFTTSYAEFKNFLNDLEKSLRILDIRSVKITPKESGVYDYSVEFETYWLKPS